MHGITGNDIPRAAARTRRGVDYSGIEFWMAAEGVEVPFGYIDGRAHVVGEGDDWIIDRVEVLTGWNQARDWTLIGTGANPADDPIAKVMHAAIMADVTPRVSDEVHDEWRSNQ